MRRHSASHVLFLATLIVCYNQESTFFTSAQGFFNNRQRNHQSQPSDQSERNPQTFAPSSSPPPLTQVLEIAEHITDSYTRGTNTELHRYTKSAATSLLSKMRCSAEIFASIQRSSLISTLSFAKSRLSSRSRRHLSVSIRQDLQTTTRLSGGADPPPTASDPEDASSTQQAIKPTAKRAFLGSQNLRKAALLPKKMKGKGAIVQKVKEGVNVMQQTGSRVAPPFVTVLSLLYTADKGISFLSLYAISLLGASCGFYLFLYFITIGYALGISLPLAAALYVYNVSTNT
jgi:hypothetical protein